LKPFFARYVPGLFNTASNSRNRLTDPLDKSEPRHHYSKTRDLKLRPDIMNTAYELHSRDDLSEEVASTKPNQSDDEARLWSGNKNARRNTIGQAPKGSFSADRVGGNADGNAIYVTSETKIDYGRP
jgi:hypothetical protein